MKIRHHSWIVVASVFFLLGLRAEAEAPTSAEKPAETAADHDEAPVQVRQAVARPGVNECIADPIALADIRARREELENRERDLNSRDSDLAARQKAIDEEIKRLESLREQIAKLEEATKTASGEKVARVVETLSNMSPKAAAALFMQVDDAVAVAAMMQLEPIKLGKIMNQLDPARSSKLTEILAGVSRARRPGLPVDTSRDVAANAKKGGETKP